MRLLLVEGRAAGGRREAARPQDLGDTAGAIADLEAVLKLSPAPREAPLARERLDVLRAPPCEPKTP